MNRSLTNSQTYRRFSTNALAAVLALSFIALVSACDDFYSDQPPTPDIAQPTPANTSEGNPEELIELNARAALAETLGIDPGTPRKILLDEDTWTDSNPGCYPPPPGVSNGYLVPGLRLLMEHDNVLYEYNSDLGGGTGALCKQTQQLVPVEPAFDLVQPSNAATPDPGAVYINRSEEEVIEFNTEHSDVATIQLDVAEWELEVLVGGWINIGPDTEPVKAYRSGFDPLSSSVVIEVAVPEEIADSADENPSQVWVLVDTTNADSTYEFKVAE